MRFGLKEHVIAQIHGVFAKHEGIKSVLLYGSRAKGTFKNGSDIDLTIVDELDYKEFSKVELELDDLDLPYMIDLSMKNHIDNPDLLAHIGRVGVIFYNRDGVLGD